MSHWIASYFHYSEEEDSNFITSINPWTEYAPYIYDSLGEKAAGQNCGCSGCGGVVEFTRAEIAKALRKSKTKRMKADSDIIDFFDKILTAMKNAKQNTVTIRFS